MSKDIDLNFKGPVITTPPRNVAIPQLRLTRRRHARCHQRSRRRLHLFQAQLDRRLPRGIEGTGRPYKAQVDARERRRVLNIDLFCCLFFFWGGVDHLGADVFNLDHCRLPSAYLNPRNPGPRESWLNVDNPGSKGGSTYPLFIPVPWLPWFPTHFMYTSFGERGMNSRLS